MFEIKDTVAPSPEPTKEEGDLARFVVAVKTLGVGQHFDVARSRWDSEYRKAATYAEVFLDRTITVKEHRKDGLYRVSRTA